MSNVGLNKAPVSRLGDEDVDAKLKKFNSVFVMHPLLKTAMDEIEIYTQQNSEIQLISLIGPTGVGKSSLIKLIRKHYLAQEQAAMDKDPGYIPFVTVEAPASGHKTFSWKTFYKNLAQSLNEPMINDKVSSIQTSNQHFNKLSIASRGADDLRMIAEQCLQQRKTKLLIVEEAIHISNNFQSKSVESHMMTLKSIANTSKVKLLLVGSYDLLSANHLNDQVSRRSACVHLPRYQSTNKEDVANFSRLLKRLQDQLPLDNKPDLMMFEKSLMVESMGCAGILKRILSETLIRVMKNDGVWENSLLEKSLMAESQCQTIIKSILEGEKQIGYRTNIKRVSRLSL